MPMLTKAEVYYDTRSHPGNPGWVLLTGLADEDDRHHWEETEQLYAGSKTQAVREAAQRCNLGEDEITVVSQYK